MQLIEKNISEVLADRARRIPDKQVLTYRDNTITYSELVVLIDGFANELISRGLKAGDHVALWGYNSTQWVIAMFGIIRAGGVATLINYSAPLDDVTALMQFSDVKYIVYGDNREVKRNPECVESVYNELGIPSDFVIDIRNENASRWLDATAVSDRYKSCSPIEESSDSRRTSVIMFTSGTSSAPKAVMLSQYGMINSAMSHNDYIKECLGSKSCIALPLFHSFGMQSLLSGFLCEGHIFLVDTIKPEIISELVYRNEITDMFTVAAVYLGLMELKDFEHKVAPYLKFCVIGGALTQASHMIKMESAYYNATFANGYGQTESSPGVTFTSPEDSMEKRISTVGKPFPLLTVHIVDPSGNVLPDNVAGEIVIKGYSLMNGYYKLPKEQQAIDEEGWLHTGDLGFFDEEGYLHFAGRIKDIIIKNGENITPSEIEAEILKMPEINDVKVFGAPHPVWGESIEACIIWEDKERASEEELRNRLKNTIAPFKIPSHFFVFESFPHNTNGKISQIKLKEDMLLKLRRVNIEEGLKSGICMSSISVTSSVCNIEPISDMLRSFAENLEYEGRRVRHITHATRAWMTERISYSNRDVEAIKIDIIFREKALRIRFTDGGEVFNIEKNRNSNPNLTAILDAVDDFSMISRKKAAPQYCMDFAYDEDFDVVTYLLHTGNNGNGISDIQY